MVHASSTPSAPPPINMSEGFQAAVDYSTAVTESLMQAQRLQLEMLSSWQSSVAAFNQDLLDMWACRWAGGVPIDG
ncbi:MAG: hypothetical protein KGL90_01925 [Burkholderiales bacterium]|nr:hypothetical protein [Burkholderiales bacterium]